MSNFIICTRNIEKGEFGSEPGATKFLKLPSNSLDPKPTHAILKREWINEVRSESATKRNENTGRDCGEILVFVHNFIVLE